MAEKNNATCSICGKGYHACYSCKDSMQLQPWKNFTDTAEHYKVFQVVRGYSTGIYNKDEAKEKFKNIDLRDLEDYRPHIKQIIKNILKEDKPGVEAVENIEESIKTEVLTEEVVVEKPIYSRKRGCKTEVE